MGAAVILVFSYAAGLSVGGEYTSSIVYLESAPEGKRGLFTSTSMMGAIGGGILLGLFWFDHYRYAGRKRNCRVGDGAFLSCLAFW